MDLINFKLYWKRAKLPVALSLIVAGLTFIVGGCTALLGTQTGVVIARRAQIRSSTAVVAADLLEVSRGDSVEILDSSTVEETKEKWFYVRAHDEAETEGWIEARNLMTEEVLGKSRQLAGEDKDVPAQAAGQLRAAANLRSAPDRVSDENIMMRLESGASFEIVGWKRVPPPAGATSAPPDSGQPANNQNGNAPLQAQGDATQVAPDDTIPAPPPETDEIWYKVRIPSNVAPAPGGWVFGKQVELQVPNEIIFYRTGREFVAWARLDNSGDNSSLVFARTKSGDKEVRPSGWVILEKDTRKADSDKDKPSANEEETDFDDILVMGYDRANQEHYTAYKSGRLRGFLPLRVEGTGENKTFIVKVKLPNGEKKELRFSVYRNERNLLKVRPPDDLSSALISQGG